MAFQLCFLFKIVKLHTQHIHTHTRTHDRDVFPLSGPRKTNELTVELVHERAWKLLISQFIAFESPHLLLPTCFLCHILRSIFICFGILIKCVHGYEYECVCVCRNIQRSSTYANQFSVYGNRRHSHFKIDRVKWAKRERHSHKILPTENDVITKTHHNARVCVCVCVI